MQGFVTKLSVRRLSNGAIHSPGTFQSSAQQSTTATTRRNSIGAFESSVRARRHSLSGPPSLLHNEFNLLNTQPKTSWGGVETLSWRCDLSPFNNQPFYPREITWLAGAPGAGKGTNSACVSSARGYDAPTIVVSSLLETPECKAIKDAGGMVDDAFVFNELVKELAKPEYRNGVVVDGFPRTEKQAAMISELYESVSPTTSFKFVTLFINEEASVGRQLSRGESIRKLNLVRKAGGLDLLEERATDVNADAARLRYSNFRQQYDAINKLSARFPLSVVDASGSIEAVRQRLYEACAAPLTKAAGPVGNYSTVRARQHQQRQQTEMVYA